MNVIQRKVLLFPYKNLLIQQSVRSAHWNKDWMPAPYPETPEQRAASAKKYGLFPEEYEPRPDDGLGAGDYPDLKNISVESRDPFYPYDFPEHRKNFGEPMHILSDINGEDRTDFDIDKKARFSKTTMLVTSFGVIFSCIGLTYLCKYYGIYSSRPVLARHYPRDGPHYKYQS